MPRYTVKSRLVSVGRDYEVRDEGGELVFELDGKVRFARTFVLRNREGDAVLRVREKQLCLDPTFVITSGDETVAIVRRTTTSDASIEKFEIEVAGSPAMTAKGSFIRDGYEILGEVGKVGSVSREPLTAVHEIFHVSVVSDQDPALVLAIAMSIVETDPSRGQYSPG